MPDPNFMLQLQQMLQSLGPYAGPAAGGLATAGALIPPIAYAANPQMRQQMNQGILADLDALLGLAGQAYNYTLPGAIGNVMEARRTRSDAIPWNRRWAPDVAAMGAAEAADYTSYGEGGPGGTPTPEPTRGPEPRPTPAPTPPPTPPPSGPPQFPGRGSDNLLKILALAGASAVAAPLLFSDVGAAVPAMRQRAAQDVGALGAGIEGMAQSRLPLVRAVARPFPPVMQAAGARAAAPSTATPTPTMTPQMAPTSAQSPTATATSYPPGYQREYHGQLWVSKGNDRWEIYPLPSGQLAGR